MFSLTHKTQTRHTFAFSNAQKKFRLNTVIEARTYQFSFSLFSAKFQNLFSKPISISIHQTITNNKGLQSTYISYVHSADTNIVLALHFLNWDCELVSE